MKESRRCLQKRCGSVVWLITLMLLLPAMSRAVDGTLDPSFGGNASGLVATAFGGTFAQGNGLAIQNDGKIVTVGFNDASGSTDFVVSRYNTDGTLDTSFGNTATGIVRTDFSGSGSDDRAFAVAIQTDGKIVVAGFSYALGSFDFALARYNTNGTLDTSFGSSHTGKILTDFSGNGSQDELYAIALQNDGKIVVGGTTDASGSGEFALARYNPDGTLDTSLGNAGTGLAATTFSGAGSDAEVYALAIQSDGKIVAAGYSADLSGNFDFALARYNTNGTLDTSFGSSHTGKILTDFSGNGSHDDLYAVAIQSDGKIVVGGTTDASGTFKFVVARYDANGALDTTFGSAHTGLVLTDFGGSDAARALAIQSDGKILAAGQTISQATNLGDFALVRYNTDGTLDTSFGSDGTGLVTTTFAGLNVASVEAYAVAIESDGKIVATGWGGNYSGTYFFVLARYQVSTSACTADATHLCLAGNRFRVSVQWTDYNTNVTAAATAVPFVDESGFFYFQDPANIEIMVKVHNACAGFGHFWFFSAATTNIGYTITVTDTKTGQTETYSNPAHVLSAAVTDQSSFASCP